jgi:hypothetical protein
LAASLRFSRPYCRKKFKLTHLNYLTASHEMNRTFALICTWLNIEPHYPMVFSLCTAITLGRKSAHQFNH